MVLRGGMVGRGRTTIPQWEGEGGGATASVRAWPCRRTVMDCGMVNVTDDVIGHAAMLFRDGSRFWIQRVIQPIVVLIGVVGNIVTIVVLTRRRMTSSTNTYLTALAFTDLVYLVCMYALSFENHPDLKSADYLWYWRQWKYFLWIVDCTSKI